MKALRDGVSRHSICTARSRLARKASRRPIASQLRLMASLVSRTPSRSNEAMRRAIASAAATPVPAGTTRLTSPMRSARSAVMRSSAASSSSLAILGPVIMGINIAVMTLPKRSSGSPR